MSLLPLLFLTFLPFISSHLIAVAPAIGIAGQAYPIRITSDGGTTTATIYGSANGVNSGSTAGFTSVITAGSSASDITLTIPSSAPTGQYRLDITTTTNASAIYRSDITIWYHPYDIAIELDKPVYQPGQTVYIQLIVIDNQMKPVQLTGAEGVRLEMSDSKQTKLARISNITTDTYGMVTLSLPLSTEPSYGTYTLSLTRGNFFITSTTFELMSYQLPKFSVVVASHQSSLTSTSTKLSGNITAMYVYGKPVQGTVSINITQAPYTPWYGWEGIMPIGMMPPRMVDAVGDVGVGGGVAIGGPSGSSSSSSTTKSVLATLTIPLDATGVTQWSIDTQGKSVSSNGITITATVTETATGASESGSTHVSYAWQSIQTAIVGSDTAVKPGIPFICALLAVDVDGKPVDGTFTLTVNEQSNVFPYSRQLIQKSITTSQGRVTFEITGNISSTATSINVNIQGQSITASAYANFGIAYSPSKSYVEISQTSTSLVLEQDASFTIRTAISSTAHTSNTATAIWSIISQGDIITGGTSALTLSNGLSTTGVTIPITSAIKGSGTVLVYIRLTSGEVIADSLPINVPVTYPLDVTATFNPKSSQPGDEIVVDVDTSGVAARVALAAVDEAVLLVAGKGSRINIQSLLTASDRTLASVATSTSSSKSSPYTYYYRTRTATADVFTNSKVVVLTDTSTSIPVINPYEYDGQFPPVAAAPGGTGPVAVNAGGGAGGGAADNAAPSPTTSKDATSSSSSTAPTRVRSYFPESFLTFKPITTDATGKATVPLTTPDSITTWNLHAIAMSSRGLGISSTSTLTVMLPLFLDVYLPKIAVRGEIIPITIAIKSYISSTTTVTLTLAPSSQYTIITSSSSTNTAGNNHFYTLPVAGTSIVAVTYIIQPKVLGEIQIAANATSAVYSDGIITSLKITPEGLPRTYTLNQLITLDTSTPTSTITWSTYLPAEAVPGSATAYLHVTGDLMGQVMSNVEGLVQQPTGCGEQNMINFAPLIYVTSYITSAKLVKPDLVSRAITMMRQGYARELNYRRTDGSFSAFGNNDPIGSIWLSAFVLRCFAQSRVHTNLGMYVDPQVLKVTGDYLVGKQNSGGDYPLIGKVLHDDMTGGTGQVASPALTAYITLTLIETGGYDDAVNKGLNYLVSQASAVTGNLYQTILLAYTLKRGGSTSSATTSLYTAMKAAAKTDADGMYWSTTTSTPSNEKASPWCYHCQPKSLQVEMTAYALLTLLAYDDLVTAFPVAKWLLNHRSSLGGYSSTQDTVVALEALSAYAVKATGNSDMSLSISQDGIATSSITINAQNSDLLQSKPITVNNGSSLIITATGTGRALIQLAVAYHVNTDTTTPSYNMNVDYAKSNNNDTLTVQACVQALNNEKSGMIVSEVGLFTGYEPISSSVSALTAKGPASLIRRVDTSPRNVVLYWGDVITTTSPTCITFLASRVMNVDSLQDAVSTTYSYYKPQIAVSKSVSYEATSKPVPTPGPNVPSSGMILVPSTLFVILLSIFVTIVA